MYMYEVTYLKNGKVGKAIIEVEAANSLKQEDICLINKILQLNVDEVINLNLVSEDE